MNVRVSFSKTICITLSLKNQFCTISQTLFQDGPYDCHIGWHDVTILTNLNLPYDMVFQTKLQPKAK